MLPSYPFFVLVQLVIEIPYQLSISGLGNASWEAEADQHQRLNAKFTFAFPTAGTHR